MSTDDASLTPTSAPNSSKRNTLILIGCMVVGVGMFVALPVVGILAAVAIPNFVAMDLKSKRAEVPGNVDGLKTAELAYDAAFDGYQSVGSATEGRYLLGREPHSFLDQDTADFDKIGWQPDGMVRGIYWVVVTDGGRDFEVHGICDVDGDGQYAEYVATRETNATMVSPYDVY